MNKTLRRLSWLLLALACAGLLACRHARLGRPEVAPRIRTPGAKPREAKKPASSGLVPVRAPKLKEVGA